MTAYMVLGIGVDIIEIKRIREIIERYGRRFVDKVFTPVEVAYCESKKIPFQHYAARFAAKEAVAKAISTGWRGDFRWKDVEVSNDDLGQPSITLYGRLAAHIDRRRIYLSLSHSDNSVIAFVIIEAMD
jgi:holo-[acyl-carrier protein] synthase